MSDYARSILDRAKAEGLENRERKIAAENAMIEANQEVKGIRGELQSLSVDLDIERQERRVEDEKIFKHTEKYDKRNFILALIGTAIALAALVVAIIALVK